MALSLWLSSIASWKKPSSSRFKVSPIVHTAPEKENKRRKRSRSFSSCQAAPRLTPRHIPQSATTTPVHTPLPKWATLSPPPTAEGGARLSRDEDGIAGGSAGVCPQEKSHTGPRVLLHAGTETEPRDGAAVSGGLPHPPQPTARAHAARCAYLVWATCSISIQG